MHIALILIFSLPLIVMCTKCLQGVVQEETFLCLVAPPWTLCTRLHQPALLSTMFGGRREKCILVVASAEISDCCCSCTSAVHHAGGGATQHVRDVSWCRGHQCITRVHQKSPLLGPAGAPLVATWLQPALTQLVRLWRLVGKASMGVRSSAFLSHQFSQL